MELTELMKAIAALLVPVVVAVIGHMYTRSLKERDRRARYIELAVDILKEPPQYGDDGLRKWATDVINFYSDVKMSPALQKSLVTRQALQREAVERFDRTVRAMPTDERHRMLEMATRMNFRTLQDALPDSVVNVTKTKATLGSLGYYRGPLDDRLDADFFEAVTEFQKDERLTPADGIFGPDTFKAMMRRVAGDDAPH